jgi:hypothetical protein
MSSTSLQSALLWVLALPPLFSKLGLKCGNHMTFPAMPGLLLTQCLLCTFIWNKYSEHWFQNHPGYQNQRMQSPLYKWHTIYLWPGHTLPYTSLFCFWFCNAEDWTRGLLHTRQAFYHLSYPWHPRPIVFETGSCYYVCPRWPQTRNPFASASWRAGL